MLFPGQVFGRTPFTKELSMIALRLSLFVLACGLVSAAQASVCQEVQRRLGDGRTFQNFFQDRAETAQVRFEKTETAGEYLVRSDEGSGRIKMRDYGLFCTFKALDEGAYFPSDATHGFSVPNRKGECWVYAARISRIVPDERHGDFVREGFCVSPVVADPETAWHGTSAFLPVTGE